MPGSKSIETKSPDSHIAWWQTVRWRCFFLIMVTVLAYVPALQCGFIWDDDDYVTNNTTLRSVDGLINIWLNPDSTPQYYPLTHTSFWVEYQLWGLVPFGYHLVNVLLHAVNAVLLWQVLRRLELDGAWLAAAVFALHPVMVESVAWITERKNVLSGMFYLMALLLYLRFYPLAGKCGPVRRQVLQYLTVFFLFLCALLSKTVTCSLPAVLVLLIWWKRGRIDRRDLFRLLPLFVVGLVMALVTAWMERYHVGARGETWELSAIERCLVAGRALWFYAGKLAWPHPLIFIYPRWQIDSTAMWQYAFPMAALILVVTLWLYRKQIGKGPLIAVLIFGGTLVPALGFFDVFPFRYSFVADHFQYLASIGLIALYSAAWTRTIKALGRYWSPLIIVSGSFILAVLGSITWRQTHVYHSLETLWCDTLEKNPEAWMAHNNLGLIRGEQGRHDEEFDHYRKAVSLNVAAHEAHINLGGFWAAKGKTNKAIDHYEEALKAYPGSPEAHNNLGLALASMGKYSEAIQHYQLAIQNDPDYADAYYNWGNISANQGNLEEAKEKFYEALRLDPEISEAHNNLGVILAKQREQTEAISHYREAIRLDPNNARAYQNLAKVWRSLGRTANEIRCYRQLLRIEPEDISGLNDLASVLATSSNHQFRDAELAVALAQKACELTKWRDANILKTLAAAYAERGDLNRAVDTAEQGLRLTDAKSSPQLVMDLRDQLASYKKGPSVTGSNSINSYPNQK